MVIGLLKLSTSFVVIFSQWSAHGRYFIPAKCEGVKKKEGRNWTLGFKCPPPAFLLRSPSILSIKAQLHASSSEMPSRISPDPPSLLHFHVTGSISLPLCWVDATSSLLSGWIFFWGVGWGWGMCAQKRPRPSCLAHSACAAPSPQQFRSRQHLETRPPGLSAAQWGFACKYKYICTPRAFRLRIPWLALHTWA